MTGDVLRFSEPVVCCLTIFEDARTDTEELLDMEDDERATKMGMD